MKIWFNKLFKNILENLFKFKIFKYYNERQVTIKYNGNDSKTRRL